MSAPPSNDPLFLRDALAKAEYEAKHDDLTGLLNRRGLRAHLLPLGEMPIAVVMLDLDGLKQINDAQGHSAGDQAIVNATRALGSCVRPHDFLARWGGDEFVAVLVSEDAHGPSAETLAVRFAKALTLSSGEHIRLSLGLATGQACDFDVLLNEADAHMRKDKQKAKQGAL